MKLLKNEEIKEHLITSFFCEHWGSPQMVISSGTYQCDKLDGFGVLSEQGEVIGLITYIMRKEECEIISLDSIVEKKGIGTSLLEKVEATAKASNCTKMKLITTNDNLHALGFYQKRGYQLTGIVKNAVERGRRVKQEIPLLADNNITIRDELILEKQI